MIKCVICSNRISSVFSLGLQPMANKYPEKKSDFEDEFKDEMKVYLCEPCGYVNVPCGVERSSFFEDYYYLSSVNKELAEHFDGLSESIAQSRYGFVIDIGSNDGVLLKPLTERGVRCIGIDPSENVSAIANKRGLKTEVGFFDRNMATKISQNYEPADLVTASSVFTHLENPLEFFDDVKKIIKPTGSVIIEVEYLPKIFSEIAFERFYFDRPHYYSLRALSKIGEARGFKVVDAELINVHGGSIRVTFSRDGTSFVAERVKELLRFEGDLLSKVYIEEKYSEFQKACDQLKAAILNYKKNGIKVAGYGCPARFSTITNYAGIGNSLLDFVIDDSTLKQARYSPGAHIPIVQYREDLDIQVFIVFAYEYIKSIKHKVADNKYKFFKPVPYVEI